jgi:hypothetical protein
MNGNGRTGWASRLALASLAALIFETITGLAVTLAPFHAAVQWGVIVHTVLGLAVLVPLGWYCAIHWLDYRRFALSANVLLGYVATAALLVCLVSGVVVTWQGLLETRSSWAWRQTHLISTLALVATVAPHLILAVVRLLRQQSAAPAYRFLRRSAVWSVPALAVVGGLAALYPGAQYANRFPDDYSFLYGKDRPFAPSLARTATNGAFDARSLSGSETCGTAGCHTEIVREWKPSAHRYAAMDTIFQGIQAVMAKQNGPESTRYCGGCHDPISLFSGTKNVFVDNLTSLEGYNEGVSCLTCHSIRETDIKGNANYTIVQPSEYLWQWSNAGAGRVARDFLIRTYPTEHNRLSKRMFKTPEYCAACHKQFIDQEVNRVGWVQLQNQYDNWAASHWNQKGDPTKTVECRECHMPLVESTDPAAGDAADYNRTPRDGRHRNHRFIASNQLMPAALKLEGWEEQVRLTEQWLQGRTEVPEIQHKWASGPIVQVTLEAPPRVRGGERFPVRVVLASNKVGHDFPTGPLDIIQSWVEVRAYDDKGNTIFSSGARDEKNFIEPGTFLFKAEPVDQYGNLIDRHNLWEMVGVRYRRSLFPGYSDAVEYMVSCPSALTPAAAAPLPGKPDDRQRFELSAPPRPGTLLITATLQYRKVDQFLLNFLFGEKSGVTAPVVEVARAEARVEIEPPRPGGARSGR